MKYTRAVHKESELFFLIFCFTYNLIKLISLKVLPSTLDTPLATFFPVLERVLERVLPDGAKVPYRIFIYFLYTLKSATFYWEFQLWEQEKVRRGQIWRVGRLGDNSRVTLHQKFTDNECICQQMRHKFWGNTMHLQFVGQNQVVRTFTDSHFFGNFTDHALFQRDLRPLTWKAVQIWGRLRWTFCPIWNAGTTRDIAYGSNNSFHKPVATSEKFP